MANLAIVITAQNMASGVLRSLNSELGGLDQQAGFASRGLTGLQGVVRAGLAAAAVAGSAAVAGLGAGLVVAANKAGDFEAQINLLTVAARQSGTGMDDLRAAAMAVGSDVTLVGISSSEAADAMTGFYRAGMTTTDVFGDLQGYLAGTVPLSGALRASIDLAAASELDLAQASDLVTVAMNTFGLSAGDAAMISNSFVGAADASVASVAGLAEGMQNIGPVAAAMGMSLNDTNIALALLSTRGIQGSEAGTALRSMLLNLQSGTSTVTDALADLNIALYDQQGNMLPLPNIIGQLQTAFAGLTEEQRNQYGQSLAGTYGLRALNTLVAEGVPGWEAMETAVANAATAQEVAAARTQGFNAAMENLGGVIETFLIGVGTPLIENFLTPGVSLLAGWIAGLQPMIPTTHQVSMGFQTLLGYGQQVLAWIAATVGPVLELVGQFVSWKDVLIVLGGVIASVLIGGLASIVAAAAPVIAVFAALVAAVALVRTAWEENWGGIRDTVLLIIAQVQAVLGGLSTYIQMHGGEVTGWITTAWSRIQTIVSQVVEAISTIIGAVLGQVALFIYNHGEAIQAFLAGAWERIGVIINLALVLIQETVVPILQGIGEFIATHSAEIQAVLSAAWTVITTVISTVLAVIEGLIRTVLAIIRGDWDTAWTEIQTIAETVWNAIVTVIQTVFGPIVEWIAGKLEEIKGWFETKWNEIKTAVQTKIDEILTAVGTWLTNTLNTIQSFDLGAAARALFQKVVTGIGAKIGEALEAVAGFLDDAFVAIESFDLKAAAETFFGTTLPGIAAKAAEALVNVGTWLSDTFNRIREKDLKGAAEGMFQTAIAGITAKITVALERAEQWLRDTAQKIRSFDLEAAAATLFGTIIPGLLEKAALALTKVQAFLLDIGRKIARASFESETMKAIQTVVVGIIQKAIDIIQAVRNFLRQIANAIREFSLFDAGVSLVQGFINGIGSMVGAAIAAAVNAVQSAIAAAWAAVQPGSPSRVGQAIGSNLVEGIAVGIEGMGSHLVAVMREVMGDLDLAALEEAGEIAQTVESIVGTMTTLIQAAGALAAFEIPDGLTAAIDDIAVQIEYVIGVFVEIAGRFAAEGLEAAGDFADTADAVLGVFSSAVDVVATMAEYTSINIRPAATSLADSIGVLTAELARVASEIGPEALAAAAASGELFEQAMAPWEAGVDVVAALAEYTAVVIGPAAFALSQQMAGLARHLANVANDIGPDMLQQASTAGQLFADAMAPWREGVDVVAALAEYTFVRIGPAAFTLSQQMTGLARHLANVANDIGPEALASAVVAAGQLQTVVGVWEPAIAAMAVLAGHTPTVIGPTAEIIANQIRGLAVKMRQLMADLADLGDLGNFVGRVQWFISQIIGLVESMGNMQNVLGEPINLYAQGFDTGYSWIDGVIDGLYNRLDDLEALMDYIRGLFPSSPAKYGPWRRLPDGAVVGRGFGQDLAVGLSRQQRAVAAAMDKLRRELALGGGPGIAQPVVTAGGGARPVLAAAGGGGSIRPPLTITISGNTFSSRSDIDYLMDEMDRRLRLRGAFRL